MKVILFDDEILWKNLLPLTFTRPVSEIRFGILTIKEKWEKHFGEKVFYQTQTYLQEKYKNCDEEKKLFINSGICPNASLIKAISDLNENQVLVSDKKIIAFVGKTMSENSNNEKIIFNEPLLELNAITDIFTKNAEALEQDFELITQDRISEPIDSTVTIIGDRKKIFLEKGAKAQACILNTTTGSIYLGANSEIMEGSVVRGALALCEHSTLKLSAKIYGATTIGPQCKVGGEINNSVIFGYSNKAHDGFLGNSIIGEWCNLGADSNNSNLKNNYANVKIYNYHLQKQVDSGLQFCGLIMGDHSKSGINTMFNTGTVVGVACNIYGGDFPPTHLKNFSWVNARSIEKYKLDKFFETASKVFERRKLILDTTEKNILKEIFEA